MTTRKKITSTGLFSAITVGLVLNLASPAIAATSAPAKPVVSKPLNIVAPTSHKAFGPGQTSMIVDDDTVAGGKCLLLEVTDKAPKPWHAGINSFIGGDIKPGDRIEATLWLKMIDPLDGGKVLVQFQLTEPPRTEFVKKTLSLTSKWTEYKVEYTATSAQAPYSTMFGLQAGGIKQTIAIGPITIVNLGK
jgi:hypothetical protein